MESSKKLRRPVLSKGMGILRFLPKGKASEITILGRWERAGQVSWARLAGVKRPMTGGWGWWEENKMEISISHIFHGSKAVHSQ